MKKVFTLVLLLAFLLPVQTVKAATVQKIYIVPVSLVGNYRGFKYFKWRFGDGIACRFANIDYGFFPQVLILAYDITPEDHANLILNSDVYVFPDNLDQSISDRATIDNFFEFSGIPTDWMTPSTTYRELFRRVTSIYDFNSNYALWSQGGTLITSGLDLDKSWNDLTAQQKVWFSQTAADLHLNYAVQGNPKLRLVFRQISDIKVNQPYLLGEVYI